MAEPLSPADRSSLAAEQGPVNMTVGGVLLFEDGPGLRHDRVVELLAQRLHLIPRYRQRLAQPAPGVTNPVWVDDDDFDLEWHVRRAMDDLRLTTDLLAELARTRPQAPMTTLNRGIGPNRRYAMARAPLPAAKTAGRAAGATVNDVVLATVAGALRPALPVRVLSFDGQVCFGLLADRDLDPPLAAVAQALRDSLDETL